jgi:hypothetical protein
LREVFCPVLKFGEEKWTFAKVEEGNVDFFYAKMGLTKSGLTHCLVLTLAKVPWQTAPQAVDFGRLVVRWTCLREHPQATLQTKYVWVTRDSRNGDI